MGLRVMLADVAALLGDFFSSFYGLVKDMRITTIVTGAERFSTAAVISASPSFHEAILRLILRDHTSYQRNRQSQDKLLRSPAFSSLPKHRAVESGEPDLTFSKWAPSSLETRPIGRIVSRRVTRESSGQQHGKTARKTSPINLEPRGKRSPRDQRTGSVTVIRQYMSHETASN